MSDNRSADKALEEAFYELTPPTDTEKAQRDPTTSEHGQTTLYVSSCVRCLRPSAGLQFQHQNHAPHISSLLA